MLYKSTRGNQEIVTGAQAVLAGIAKDGGLFIMDHADLSRFDWKKTLTMTSLEMSEAILSFFFDDMPDMKALVERAYRGKFTAPDLTPLVKVGNSYILELFHGPTCAFKDVALSVLPELMSSARELTGMEDEIVILTATSGDTGKAALEGFADVKGIRIMVFFPHGGVSPVQKLQMTTQKGGNVLSCAVVGNFDDTQSAVKQIFTDVKKNGLPAGTKATLSSANSINIGRLVPQIMYYFKAYAELVKTGQIAVGAPVDYTVPTGNFGDILAGYLAKMMGLPVGKLICASNENNVLAEFLHTGLYDRVRPFHKTVSPSMDILISSNLERLLYLLSGNDDAYVAGLMAELADTGRYSVTPEIFSKLQESFGFGWTDDEDTKAAIREVWEENHYLMDTHTAVAWAVADTYMATAKEDYPMVVLSTASPYKFPQAVAQALGLPDSEDEFALMKELQEATGIPAPGQLSNLRELEVRFKDIIEKEEMPAYVLKHVCGQ